MAANWLEGLLNMARNALRAPNRSEKQNAEQALADVQAQLTEARANRDREDEALNASMALALDGDVTASELESQRGELARAQRNIDQLERLERALVDRVGAATRKSTARDTAERWVKLREHVGDLTEGMRKICAGVALILAGIKQVRAANAKAKAVAPVKPVSWPELWEFPRKLSSAICMDLERGDPITFRFFGSLVQAHAPLEEQHRLAVSEVLPPDPERKAA